MKMMDTVTVQWDIRQGFLISPLPDVEFISWGQGLVEYDLYSTSR